MTTYHIGLSGEPSVCRASKKPCPFGGDSGKDDHYESLAEARTVAEARHENAYGHVSSKKTYTWGDPEQVIDGLQINEKSGRDLFTYSSDEVKTDSGVTARDRDGHLVNVGYFSNRAVRGKIDVSSLNNESYKDFGFDDAPEDEHGVHRRRAHHPLNYESTIGSKHELRDASAIDTSAMNFFSSDNYKWFNSAIIHPEKMGELAPGHEDDEYLVSGELGKDMIDQGNKLGKEYAGQLAPDHRDYYRLENRGYGEKPARTRLTQRNVVDTANKLDTAIANNSSKEQRVVYRGVNDNSEIFSDYDTVKDYADNNLGIGTEISFKGYKSSSISPALAHKYAGRKGIVYEILTPEGANIASVSAHKNEHEVLLPRDQRYIVVGRHTLEAPSPKGKRNMETSSEVVQLVAVNSKGEVLDGTNADPIKPFNQ